MELTVLAVIVAVAAAVRSTWSPCGWSMLSTITPLSERSKGHRYGVTAGWFVVGALAGGATLGALAALLSLGVAAADLSTTTTLVAAGALAFLAQLIDLGAFGRRPPFFHRQVNDDWLSAYRPWVYGVGFGWQIGAGLTTYIMTAAVVLSVALAALTGSPAAALVVGLSFGLVRGLAVLLSAGLTSPAALASFHRRFGAAEEPVRIAVIAVEGAVGALAIGLAWSWVAAVAASLALALVGVAAVRALDRAHGSGPGTAETRAAA